MGLHCEIFSAICALFLAVGTVTAQSCNCTASECPAGTYLDSGSCQSCPTGYYLGNDLLVRKFLTLILQRNKKTV